MKVFAVHSHVLAKIADSASDNRHLDLGRSGIFVRASKLADNLGFLGFVQFRMLPVCSLELTCKVYHKIGNYITTAPCCKKTCLNRILPVVQELSCFKPLGDLDVARTSAGNQGVGAYSVC